MAAEIPSVKPDILIIVRQTILKMNWYFKCNFDHSIVHVVILQESTYGTHIHEKREEREARFCNTVHDIVNREGRCLIPVFALGRAQELLLILGKNLCYFLTWIMP